MKFDGLVRELKGQEETILNGRYSQKVTKLETANFSHPVYGTPRVNTFITL